MLERCKLSDEKFDYCIIKLKFLWWEMQRELYLSSECKISKCYRIHWFIDHPAEGYFYWFVPVEVFSLLIYSIHNKNTPLTKITKIKNRQRLAGSFAIGLLAILIVASLTELAFPAITRGGCARKIYIYHKNLQLCFWYFHIISILSGNWSYFIILCISFSYWVFLIKPSKYWNQLKCHYWLFKWLPYCL